MRLLKKLLRGIHVAEDTLLAVTLTALLLLAFSQVVLRNFFDTSLVWADPLVRVLVLWIGMLGALAATRDNRQISVDALTHLISGRALSAVRIVTHAFATAVCGVIAWHSFRFVAAERSYETVAFGTVPAWWLQVVIPLAFSLMTLRYALLALESMADTATGKTTGAEAEPQ